ncbi:hypothetical protein Tco_1313079 [Tanacetum coccineum]
MGDENLIRTLGDYSKPSHEGYKNTIELLIGKNMVPLRSEDPNQHLKDFLKLVDSLDLDGENRERTQDLSLYDNESWNDPRDFAKLVKAIALPQDVPSTSDRRLIELKNQVQRLMEAHLALIQPTEVNKITTSCEICSGPHDTRYCMEDPEQAFVEYASSRTDEAGATRRIQVNRPDEGQEGEGNLGNISSNPHPQPDPLAFIATEQVQKLNSMLESLRLVPQSSNTKCVCSKEDDGEVMFIEIIRDDHEPQNEGPNKGEGATTEGPTVEYFDTFPTRDELTYHKKLDPRENANGGVSNFTGKIKGMHVFVGNFTYIIDFMIIDDISSIIDPRMSYVVLGKPFVEISNMTHNPQEGVVRFTNKNDEVAYKMPHKIEQYNSLSNLEKEHTKSVYLRNEEDKRRGVEYVISKILGFYKECLELGPEYLTGMDDEGEIT